METAGIICEYNPFHIGHLQHIIKTKAALGTDAYIVCVMSGNYVQRGDFAIINKHARAKTAVLCGADVVIEIPAAYALSSARDFAKNGVYLLEALGVCDYISFGSESGRLRELKKAARIISSQQAEEKIKEGVKNGLSYASAQQEAADALLTNRSVIFNSPNNILAIEYIKALNTTGSRMQPITIKREGGEHDGSTGCSASVLRRRLAQNKIPFAQMPGAAAVVCMEEITHGRAPVLTNNMQQAILARIRAIKDFTKISGATDGLDGRFSNTAANAPSVLKLLEEVKTKRYAMSRIRRVMMCAVLGITEDDIKTSPAYIKVLAMNERGMTVLKQAGDKAALPVLIKPAMVNRLGNEAVKQFCTESRATDFYSLAYTNEEDREGGSDWRTSPAVITN